MYPLKGKLALCLNSPYFHLVFPALIIFVGFFPYIQDGIVLAGGDGDYHLTFQPLLRYAYSWAEDGTGTPVYAISAVFSFTWILKALEEMLGNVAAVKLILYFALCYLTFLSAWLVGRKLHLPPLSSLLIALFHLLNPMSFIYMGRLNMSLTIVPAAIMLYLWTILAYYDSNRKLFLAFGLVSAFFAFANTNPPLFVIMQFCILLSVGVASYYRLGRFNLMEAGKKYLVVLAAFVLFNFWWLINLVYFVSSGAVSDLYTEGTAESFLSMVIGSSGAIVPRSMLFFTSVPLDTALNYFGHFYNLPVAIFMAMIPFGTVALFLFVKKSDPAADRLLYFLLLLACLALFLMKGSQEPFGIAYVLLFKYFPFFNIFKGPVEKFGVLYIFLFTLLLMLAVKTRASGSAPRVFHWTFAMYLVFFSFPLLAGNVFPDSKITNVKGYMTGNNYQTVRYREKENYLHVRQSLAGDHEYYRTLGIPGSRDYYAVTFPLYDNKYYSGIDPLLANSSKPFLIYDNATKPLYQDIESRRYEILLGLFNVKKIILNKDLVPVYQFAGDKSVSDMETSLMKRLRYSRSGSLTIYTNDRWYLPLIYSPDHIIAVRPVIGDRRFSR